jgi:hypothetical protein
VKVTTTSPDVLILVYPPNTKGIIVACHSGGWFPQPQTEWRNSSGEIIPLMSKSHSQDGDKLFNMAMNLLIIDSSHMNVICCLQNPITGPEERVNTVLSDKLFSWIMVLITVLLVLLVSTIVPSMELHKRKQGSYCWMAPWVVGAAIVSQWLQ